MKKLKLLLLCLPFCLLVNGQAGQLNQINIPNFTVKNTLPGMVDSWISTPAALILVAQKVPGARIKETLLILQIRSGSAVICGTTVGTARPLDPFDVRTFNTADLVGMLGNCHELKEGTYTICAQFFNLDKIAISREVCKDFRVEASNVEYAPPTLITPENEKKFNWTQLEGPVTFRWTPLVPKPKEPVTYRLRVWQLMQGQTGTQAIRVNSPLIQKDVENLTQTTVSSIITGPCKPPYLCDFIWNVQALNRAGKPMGNNNGTSEPYTFGAIQESSKCPAHNLPEDKKEIRPADAKAITFKWANTATPGQATTYRLRVWQLMAGQNGTQAMRSNNPVVTREVRNVNEVSINSIYTGPCKPPYLCDFIWAVEMMDASGQVTCTSEPTTFKVTEETTKCAANTLPADKKEIPSADAKAINFKWTNTATPGQATTYRLRVWQLMAGQNGTQAMRSNNPIVTKEVRNANEVAINSIYTGPCKPPYLCDFIWAVEMMDASGQVTCTSEPTTFKVTDETGKCSVNTLPEDKKQFSLSEAKDAITFKWKKPTTAGETPNYRIKVWQLMDGQNSTQAMRSKPMLDVDGNGQAGAISDGMLIVRGFLTGPCKPPYLCDFIWAVEMTSRDGRIICTSEPTTFSVAEEKCPVNTLPENKKELRPKEAKQGITFKWTGTTGQPAAYRLRVWQLMAGQNGTQAMKSNNPLVTKEVRNANEVTVNSIYMGPCKPPYLCDFIWSVDMMDASGRSTCSSEPTVFKIANNDIDIQIDSFNVDCCKDGKQNIYLKIKNNLATPVKITQIKIDKINGVTANIIPSPLAPALFVNIPGNGTQVFTGQVNCIDTAKIIRIWVAAEDPVDNAITETEVEADTLYCRCDACDEKNFSMKTPPPGQISVTNSGISFNQTITVTTTPPKTIKTITAELVYFEMIPENDQCIPCDKDANLYGHFLNGSNSQQWNGPQTSLGIGISTPLMPCCSTLFRWCIRYKIEFTDCTVCSKVICYQKKKTGCVPTGGGTGTENPNDKK